MFDMVPPRIWLLLLIAILAVAPARYVVAHVTHSPSRREIGQPAEDLSWRSTGSLARNLAILTGLAFLAVFIFTPAAESFAKSPSFLPLLLAAFGGFALWTVAKGYRTGAIEPMVRGASWTFLRAEQPRRYWASMAWNGLLGGAFILGSGVFLAEAPKQALRDRCFDWTNTWSPADELVACNRLLAEHGDDDRARTIAARGSAYYRLSDYRRAGADYTAAIRLDPQDSTSRYNLGLVHEQLNDLTRAAAAYSAAIRIDNKNMDAYVGRGLIFLDTGRLDDAVADFTRAHEVKPADVVPLANRGIAYAWKDDTARAERDFAAVRRTDPGNRLVFHGESILAFRSGDYDLAIQLLSSAIARDPNDTWAFKMRANAHERLNDDRKMRADLAVVRRLELENRHKAGE